jgi:hypothetical protein
MMQPSAQSRADGSQGKRAYQRGVAESAKGACEVARISGDSRLEKRTTLLTNTAAPVSAPVLLGPFI